MIKLSNSGAYLVNGTEVIEAGNEELVKSKLGNKYLTKEEASNIDIDYIRILGFTTKGQEYLSKIKKNITIPIITGYKKNISKVLDIEYRVTKIYSLFTSNNLIKKEYQIKPIIKENND